MKINDNESKCNICEEILKVNEKSPALLEHIKNNHIEVYDLHKDNLESGVGFQVEYIQVSLLKDDEQKSLPVVLEEICEDAAESPSDVKMEEKEDREDEDVKFLMGPQKLKAKKNYELNRKRSWVWKYFDKLTSIIYRCNLCNVVLSIKRCNTNNMNRHVRTRHPTIYKAEVDKKKEPSDKYLLDESWRDSKEDIEKELDESSESMTQPRSWVWSYFDRVSSTLAQCKICKRNICHGGHATGNMNRHLKMIHNKTADDSNWVWKVFENSEDHFFSCKICQYKCMKFEKVDKSIKCILHHLKTVHGVISGDQIITGTEFELGYQE